MIIEIEALDTLFFRDGKPFTMGDDVWAEGIFPPLPSVFYGAIRASFFSNNINLLDKAKEKDDPTEKLVIKNISFVIDGNPYFPLPLDIVKLKDSKKFVSLSLENIGEYFHSKGDISFGLTHSQEVESIDKGLISLNTFKDEYIKAKRKEFIVKDMSDYLIVESKVGISRNGETRTTEEGHLYRVGMKRLNGLKILIEFEGLNLPEKGILRLGGEGKCVSYKSTNQKLNIAKEIIYKGDKNMFVLYLLTPAVFENGWLPSWIDPKTYEVIHSDKDMKIKFLTASIGKYLSIGGFDMKDNHPKPMKKMVPSGSVYYFKADDRQSLDKAISYFHGVSISEKNTANQGFGISYIGGLK